MLRNHPFSQRSKAIERSVGVKVGDDRNGGWEGRQNLRKGGIRQYRSGL